MINKEINEFLVNTQKRFHETVLAWYSVDEEDYQKYCKERNEGLKPVQFTIQKDHTIEEYFYKYNKAFAKGKALAFKANELWLMNRRAVYWEIKSEDNDLLYYEIPRNTKSIILFCCIFLAVAGAAVALGLTI